MKNWCKIVETEEYDFLVMCGEDNLHITFMNENETIHGVYQEKNNKKPARQVFDNDERLLKICTDLIAYNALHSEQ